MPSLIASLFLLAVPAGGQESGSRGEFLFYPFVEYYLDNNAEYKPQELGFGLDHDFRGKYRASEGLIYLGYGVSDYMRLALGSCRMAR